jgi:hypothetical protein
MKIYLAVDEGCWNEDKIKNGMMGGAEAFFLILRKHLVQRGHRVYLPILHETSEEVDLVIHSNSFNPTKRGKRHLLWAGSWGANVNDPRVDKVIVLSEYMKNEMKCDRASVIPAPYGKDLVPYKGTDYEKGVIVTTSNPNRFFDQARDITKNFKARGMDYDWRICGGNRLYRPDFPECYAFTEHGINHKGVLSRHELIGLLTLANVWMYPNFKENSETFCLSMIEAAFLGIPIVLPYRLPFTEVLPEAFFAHSPGEMVERVEAILKYGPDRINYNVSRYSEEVVMPTYVSEIEATI